MAFMAAMPWVIGGISALSGLASGNSANRNARDLGRQQLDLGRATLGFNQEVYRDQKAGRDKYLGYVTPWLDNDKLWLQQMDNTKRQFADADRGLTANLESSGLGTSGLGAAIRQGNRFSLASKLSRDWLSGQVDRRNLAQQLAAGFNPLAATQGVNQASNSLMGAMGDQAHGFQQIANQSYGAAGNAIGNAATLYAYTNQPRVVPAPVVKDANPAVAGRNWTDPGIFKPTTTFTPNPLFGFGQ